VVIRSVAAGRQRVSGSMLVVEGEGKEPIGQRIIETLEDLER
jgi:hypothetical protein